MDGRTKTRSSVRVVDGTAILTWQKLGNDGIWTNAGERPLTRFETILWRLTSLKPRP
jgi:hypothetical protein